MRALKHFLPLVTYFSILISYAFLKVEDSPHAETALIISKFYVCLLLPFYFFIYSVKKYTVPIAVLLFAFTFLRNSDFLESSNHDVIRFALTITYYVLLSLIGILYYIRAIAPSLKTIFDYIKLAAVLCFCLVSIAGSIEIINQSKIYEVLYNTLTSILAICFACHIINNISTVYNLRFPKKNLITIIGLMFIMLGIISSFMAGKQLMILTIMGVVLILIDQLVLAKRARAK